MLMVVMLHVLGQGGILNTSESINYWIAWLLEISAYCAVNCYALISGYVGIYSGFKLSNLVFLWCRVAFYSISITIICKCLFPDEVGIKMVISSFIPTLSGKYWYFTAYALLFLFIPLLNEGLKRLSKRKLVFVLVSVIFTVSVIQPFTNMLGVDNSNLNGGYSTWWLMILYLIGGYVRKYGLFNKITSHRTGFFVFMYFAFVLTTWFSKLLMYFLSNLIWGETKFDRILISYQSITVLGAAVALLLAFEKIEIRKALLKAVTFFAPLAFSVYLIHEHSQIIDRLIMDRFIRIAKLPFYQMIPLIIGIVLGIFLVCSLTDLIRHGLFKILKLKEKLRKTEITVKYKFFAEKNKN